MATVATPMRKLLNDPANVVKESLAGLAAAHGDLAPLRRRGADPGARGRAGADKVALISGGGSGHEPLHGGFVGPACSTPPARARCSPRPCPSRCSPRRRRSTRGAGVVHIVKNYTGDVMNFKLAAEDAEDEGIEVESVLIDDDVAVRTRSTPRAAAASGRPCWREDRRRGGRARRRPGGGGRASRGGSTSGRAPSASRCRPAPRRPPASRSSTSPTARWRSASASTASPGRRAPSRSAARARSPS